ncbi:MAG: hypothetical protein A2W07_00720 [candidate division Zixibacteria bacterium RBG_16_43_9]|nr:MAG: hypothetical protein A2W07_00720 [candidate division Zixibacteria bacterium RBG_16_43_9]
MGGYGLAYALGWSIGPLVGGVLIDLLGKKPVLLWGLIAVLGLAAALAYTRLEKKLPKDVITVSTSQPEQEIIR